MEMFCNYTADITHNDAPPTVFLPPFAAVPVPNQQLTTRSARGLLALLPQWQQQQQQQQHGAFRKPSACRARLQKLYHHHHLCLLLLLQLSSIQLALLFKVHNPSHRLHRPQQHCKQCCQPSNKTATSAVALMALNASTPPLMDQVPSAALGAVPARSREEGLLSCCAKSCTPAAAGSYSLPLANLCCSLE